MARANPSDCNFTEWQYIHYNKKKNGCQLFKGAFNMIKTGIYRHFKGGRYEVIGLAKHSETMEDMVVYRALYGEGELWVRPLAMWQETVVHNGERVPRFRYIGD